MTTKSQDKKNQIILSLSDARGQIIKATQQLPPDCEDEVFLGTWSIKDLITHLVGWDYTNLDAVKNILESKLPAFYEYYDRDWASYNARLISEYKLDRLIDLITSANASHRKLTDFLETVPAEQFTKDRGLRIRGYKVTIMGLMQVEVRDEMTHCRQIQEFNTRKKLHGKS